MARGTQTHQQATCDASSTIQSQASEFQKSIAAPPAGLPQRETRVEPSLGAIACTQTNPTPTDPSGPYPKSLSQVHWLVQLNGVGGGKGILRAHQPRGDSFEIYDFLGEIQHEDVRTALLWILNRDLEITSFVLLSGLHGDCTGGGLLDRADSRISDDRHLQWYLTEIQGSYPHRDISIANASPASCRSRGPSETMVEAPRASVASLAWSGPPLGSRRAQLNGHPFRVCRGAGR